ncbi:GNAT family N-acetyltransferase [Profundibacter sp.]
MIRTEQTDDIAEIRRIVAAAFKPVQNSDNTEPDIIDMLRDTGAMTLSLVSVKGAEILGHIAFSAVTIGGKDCAWFGLGPVAVQPDHQGKGVGSALVNAGLTMLKDQGAQGCVVLGNPAYYQRFGFRTNPDLRFADAPAQYFMALPFAPSPPSGDVIYHKAFYIEPVSTP